MKRTNFAFFIIIAIATILAARPLIAGVKVDTAEPIERAVALRTADKAYITADTGGALNGGAMKIGSKQNFTLIDVDGHNLQDGDTVRIRYTPHAGGVPDPSKASYWQESKDGIKRNRNGDPFKLKWVGTKCAFQAPSGKFVGPPTPEALLGLSDKLEGALLVELIDLTSHTPIANPNPPAAPPPSPAVPVAPPAAETPVAQ